MIQVVKAIELHRVSFAYEDRLILEELSLTVGAGDFLAIVGPNGGGKTTLLRLLMGSLEPGQGEIKIFQPTAPESAALDRLCPATDRFGPGFPRYGFGGCPHGTVGAK